jgi:hypothetical protein
LIHLKAERVAPALCLILALLSAPACLAAEEPASWPASATAPKTSEPRLYVLAFSGAAIDDVAAEVLGKALGVPFDFDPALQGPIDLHIEERLTPQQLTERFSQALTAAGGSMVRQDGQLKLIPTAKARRMAQMDRRARGVIDGYSRLGAASAASPAASLELGVKRAAPPTAPPRRLSIAWILLAAIAGAAAALAGAFTWSRVSIGRFHRPAGRREAVMDYLMAHQTIAPDALADARRRAGETSQPLEQTLNQMGRVSDEALARAYAAVTGCAIWRPADQPALTEPKMFGPTQDYLRMRGMIPVAIEDRRLTLAAIDPLDDEGIAAAAAAADRPVLILVGAPSDVRNALRTH